MANITSVVKKCCNCGCESEFDSFFDDVEYSLPDLDFRPAQTKRQEIDFGIERCPKCNYVAVDISIKRDIDSSFLQSEEYQEILNSTYPYLAKSYLLEGLIQEKLGHNLEAGLAVLKACWVLDDNNIDCLEEREKSANLLANAKLDDKTRVILLDVYRRAELFDEAKEYADSLDLPVEYQKIVEIEKELIGEYDSDCHSQSEYVSLTPSVNFETEDVGGCDSIEDIESKLFGEGQEAIIMPFDGVPTSFDLIATLEVSIDGANRWFSILHSEKQNEDEAFVYELEINEDGKLVGLDPCYSEDVINQVFDEYYKLVE